MFLHLPKNPNKLLIFNESWHKQKLTHTPTVCCTYYSKTLYKLLALPANVQNFSRVHLYLEKIVLFILTIIALAYIKYSWWNIIAGNCTTLARIQFKPCREIKSNLAWKHLRVWTWTTVASRKEHISFTFVW